jgi:hypothetical protein
MSALRQFWTHVVGPAPVALAPAVKQNTVTLSANGSGALQVGPNAPVVPTGTVARAGPGPIAQPSPAKAPPPTGAPSVPEAELEHSDQDSTNKARVKELVQRILELLKVELAKPEVQQEIKKLKDKVKTDVCFGPDSAIAETKDIILRLFHRITKQIVKAEPAPDYSKDNTTVVSIIEATKLVKERLDKMARDALGDLDTIDPAELDKAVPQDRRDRLIAELRKISYHQERIQVLEKERTKYEELAIQLTQTYAKTKDENIGKQLKETKQRIKKINDDITVHQDQVEPDDRAKERKLLGDIAKEPSVSRGGKISLLERWLIQRYQNTHPELWKHMRVG